MSNYQEETSIPEWMIEEKATLTQKNLQIRDSMKQQVYLWCWKYVSTSVVENTCLPMM